MTEPYSKTNPKFDALLRKMGALHDAKNAGYAVVSDPLHNFRACEKFGIPMYQGIAVRISDKQSRWQNLVGDATKDEVGESLEDTTMDEAVYLLLFLIALDEYKRVTPVTPEKEGNRWTNRDPYTTGRAIVKPLSRNSAPTEPVTDTTFVQSVIHNVQRPTGDPEKISVQTGMNQLGYDQADDHIVVAYVPGSPLHNDSFYGAKPKE